MFIKTSLILILMFLTGVSCGNKPEKIVHVLEHYHYTISKQDVDKYPIAEVMAALAYHECYNLAPLERWLTMEAFYN